MTFPIQNKCSLPKKGNAEARETQDIENIRQVHVRSSHKDRIKAKVRAGKYARCNSAVVLKTRTVAVAPSLRKEERRGGMFVVRIAERFGIDMTCLMFRESDKHSLLRIRGGARILVAAISSSTSIRSSGKRKLGAEQAQGGFHRSQPWKAGRVSPARTSQLSP